MNFNDFSIFDKIPPELFEAAPSHILSGLLKNVSHVADCTKSKFENLFNQQKGCHPGLQFLLDITFFNPSKAIGFVEPKTLNIPGIQSVPDGEFAVYMDKGAKFSFLEDDYPSKMEETAAKLLMVRGFWVSNQEILPNLAELALTYGFAFFTTSEMERSFSRCTRLLSPERKSMTPETICKLLFLYFNLN